VGTLAAWDEFLSAFGTGVLADRARKEQGRLNLQRCSGAVSDLSMSSCTAVIQSGYETQENLTAAFFHRGNAYVMKRQYDRAIEDYDQAIRLNPNDVKSFFNRGFTYSNKGQFDHAIEDYDQAIRLNPNYAEAYDARGNAYANKSQYDRAIEDYGQAIRLSPNLPVVYYDRGKAKRAKGDTAGGDADTAIAKQLEHGISPPGAQTQDHGRGRVGCDVNWQALHKPASEYQEYIQSCMTKGAAMSLPGR